MLAVDVWVCLPSDGVYLRSSCVFVLHGVLFLLYRAGESTSQIHLREEGCVSPLFPPKRADVMHRARCSRLRAAVSSRTMI